jgi:hypothetical protein
MAKSSSSDGVVRGSLAQMNVIDLVQSLEMGRKSCLLTLTLDNDKCEMYFGEGQVKHATYGSLTGDQPVQSAALDRRKFPNEFEGNQPAIYQPDTQGLLMEGCLLDEAKRDVGGRAKRKKTSPTPDTFRAAVLTVSDSCARGERNDLPGPPARQRPSFCRGRDG